MDTPSWDETSPLNIPTSQGPKWEDTEDLQGKYGTTSQQLITAAEGAAQGLAGPLATATEVAAGVNPRGFRLRREASPWVHGIPEAATFGLSMMAGTGEARLAAGIGEAAATAAKLGEATRLAKLGTAGIKGGAELAAL